MKSGSDEPPTDFVPRDVIIGKHIKKEIWLNNQKEIMQEFHNVTLNKK